MGAIDRGYAARCAGLAVCRSVWSWKMKDRSGMRVTGLVLAVLAGVLSMASCSNSAVNSGVVSKQKDTRPFEQPLPVNTEHRRLAIGTTAVAGVKEDGTVWTWGSGQRGQLGDGVPFSFRNSPFQLPNMSGFVEVAGTGDHFLALRSDDTVWSWGNNDKGQLGYITKDKYSATPIRVVKNPLPVTA
jgi:alpha-tubulin suppressor-like RCC1 family protein